MRNIELAVKSLRGLWVGDCIGNVGQLYFAHDILKALDEGIIKFGAKAIDPHGNCFQYSDDTEEAIVLLNHLDDYCSINQDALAKGFAKRYFERDPDGEIYGYGLNTRKVLRDIYDGVPWQEANMIIKKSEGMPSHVDSLVNSLASGKGFKDAIKGVNEELTKQKEAQNNQVKVGSCGNGSAMRVAPLGAFFCDSMPEDVIEQARLQAEVTHCHPEGIAGAIAIAMLSYMIAEWDYNSKNTYPKGWGLGNVGSTTRETLYDLLLDYVPQGQVFDGIVRAKNLLFDVPLTKLMEILGNGTHVTCQDTVPLCVYLTIRALCSYDTKEMYEKVMIEACKCFGDVDTNCAIIGGMIGIISPPPEKWVRYCQPMEGVLGDPLPENKRKPIEKGYDRDILKDVLKETKPWGGDGWLEDQAASLYEMEKSMSDVLKKPRPSFEEVLEARKRELGIK